MHRHTRIQALLAVLAVTALGIASAMGQQSGGDPRRQVLQAACTGCHELDVIEQARKTAAQWETTVAAMISRGAPVMEGEREVIVQFLAENHGPQGRNVSTAALPAAAAVPSDSPDAHGRRILREACTVCHELDFIYQARRTRSEWEETVGDMMGRGALLLEGEREVLLQFLAKRYGRPNATSVNTATAQELVAAFGLTQSEAEAVLRYKQQQGVILGWEDLRKIPGLDLKKLEAKRETLTFY